MSETDDTDDLLLIPPDFFLIDSDVDHPLYPRNNFGPYYDIVETLINQVGNLEDRINCIESASDISLVSSSFDRSFESYSKMQDNNTEFRKYKSHDELYPISTQSTPQKPHSKFKLNSLPASPNIHNRFSPRRSPRLKNDQKTNNDLPKVGRTLSFSPRHSSKQTSDPAMLSEIDNFLSKVKTIQRINASRNLEPEFSNHEEEQHRGNRNQPDDVDKMLHEIDEQKKNIELKIQQKENELLKRTEEREIVKETMWRCGDNPESVPDYGAGLKQQYYNTDKHDNYMYPMPILSSNTTNKSTDSSDSTQTTAYERGDLLNSPIHFNALNALNMHKKMLNDGGTEKGNKKHVNGQRPVDWDINKITDSAGLISLTDIWSGYDQNKPQNISKVMQKLHEEKLRRQHCEDLIQDLQTRNLELQQKLSVAVRVDESKNNTIYQFQQTLDKIAVKFEAVMKEKRSWDQEVHKLKQQHSVEMEEATKKVSFYEKEASKALTLAHGNQEKLSLLEKRCSHLQIELKTFEAKFSEVQRNYIQEIERSKELADILSQKEVELTDNKQILNNAREEVNQSRKAVEVCQMEFSSMKNECTKLQTDLRDSKNEINGLNELKRKLMSEVETLKANDKNLHERLSKTKEQLESNKLELRNFYQGQVEILVQNKLKEFQAQLDQAENSFKEDIKKREMSIAKTAAHHIQQITEKYSLEVKLLEEKHEEEKRLHNYHIMQYKQQVENLQGKLDHIQEKRVRIAQQLQKIMESQWTEALKIITSGKSPTYQEQSAFSTIDQLNSLKTKSYNNLEEVFSQELLSSPKKHNKPELPNGESNSSLLGNEGKNNGPVGFAMETPVSSRLQGGKNEAEIQKYIQLLLNRQPGNPMVDGHEQGEGVKSNDKSSWPQPVRSRKHK